MASSSRIVDVFGIDVAGQVVLDIGASTGGFTDAMLQRGAEHVVALDVGHAQLAWKLRQDRRVTVLEGVNARSLEGHLLPDRIQVFDLVTVDVSFISLKLIVSQIPPLLREDGQVVVLVKPPVRGRARRGRKEGRGTRFQPFGSASSMTWRPSRMR